MRRTVTVQDLTEASASLEGEVSVSTLVTDVLMPGRVDGLALAHHVAQRWRSIRIIVASGHARLEQDELPERAVFLAKPFSLGCSSRRSLRSPVLLLADGPNKRTPSHPKDVRMPKRKYEVRGEDDLGDVHSFHTDDRERAEEIEELMREDLDRVELIEHD